MRASELLLLAAVAISVLIALDALHALRGAHTRIRHLERVDERRCKYLLSLNKHAWRLGSVVESRKYDASEWVRCNVICVSWKGSVRVRPVTDEAGGWWVNRDRVATHVRMVEDGEQQP